MSILTKKTMRTNTYVRTKCRNTVNRHEQTKTETEYESLGYGLGFSHKIGSASVETQTSCLGRESDRTDHVSKRVLVTLKRRKCLFTVLTSTPFGSQ